MEKNIEDVHFLGMCEQQVGEEAFSLSPPRTVPHFRSCNGVRARVCPSPCSNLSTFKCTGEAVDRHAVLAAAERYEKVAVTQFCSTAPSLLEMVVPLQGCMTWCAQKDLNERI